jgi:uncharacterized membrane protein YhaH (DUF805 family)
MSQTPARISISELWLIDGTLSRKRYLGLGLLLFTIKYAIDSTVSWFIFHRSWFILDYFMPGTALDVVSNSPELRVYYATMMSLALPFIWCGVALTLKRLRAAELPSWLVKLFFVPVVNLLLFFVLCVLPSRADESTATQRLTATAEDDGPKSISSQQKELTAFEQPKSYQEKRLDNQRAKEIFGSGTADSEHGNSHWTKRLPSGLVKEDRLASALVAILIPQPISYALAILGTTVLQSYGWGLFVGIPFAVGMSSVVLYGRNQPRKLVESLFVAWLSLGSLAGLLLIYGVEGAICLLMASPIALVIASMGALVGWAIQRRPTKPGESTLIRLSIFLFLPFLMGAEYAAAPGAPLFAVRSSVTIQAPPEVVWRNVVSFSKLPDPTELLFLSGIAYPVRAKIYGCGAGAVRHCIFSTGPFIEPIEVWDRPRLLRFSVSSQPQPMFEWSFHKHLDPPHLDGFLTSRQGQFLLTPLAGGGTKLEGTTWYQHHMWPASYWRIWSDGIIHQIHLRVLRHIKGLSESSNG